MNLFEATGLAVHASLGNRILVVFSTHLETAQAVTAVAREARQITKDVKVSRANAAERIWINAGEILFTSRARVVRPPGFAPDYVLVDDHRSLNAREIDAIAMHSRPRGQVVIR